MPTLFTDKVEAMETWDQLLVEEKGYVAEYFGKVS